MSAPAVAAPFLAAAVLLAGAGVAKVWRPDDTARALRVAHLPSHRNLVRAGALAEVVVGVTAVALPGPVTGGLVAAAYAAFTVFVGVALARGWPLSSCGCFGRPDARPGPAHLVLDAGAATVSVWWSVGAPGRIDRVFTGGPWQGWPLALVTVVTAGLAYLIWTNPLERPAR
ncbi:MAG: hypothetical protein KGQ66_18485 [Acidobacteriota bacterium]|nr:hypothetical protein [Acidobacteriota bacterium]